MTHPVVFLILLINYDIEISRAKMQTFFRVVDTRDFNTHVGNEILFRATFFSSLEKLMIN